MDESSQAFLRLVMANALLFNVTAAMRVVLASLDGDTLHITAYFDRDPTDNERELLYGAAAEATGQFSALVRSDVQCLKDERPYRLLPKAGIPVFARHEGE